MLSILVQLLLQVKTIMVKLQFSKNIGEQGTYYLLLLLLLWLSLVQQSVWCGEMQNTKWYLSSYREPDNFL